MSCTFWIRRKRIAARIREEERLKAEQKAQIGHGTETANRQETNSVETAQEVEPEKPKKAGVKNGKPDKSTDTES